MRTSRYIVIGCVALQGVIACSRQQPAQTPAVPPAEPPAAATTAAPSEVEVPPPELADSSLALKRGIVTFADQHATFHPCNDKVDLWLVDQTDGVLRKAFGGFGAGAAKSMYVEAYGERGPTPQGVPATLEVVGALTLEELLYAGVPGLTQCTASPASYIVAARGNEPAWSVEIGEERMVWRQPEQPELAVAAPQAQDSEGTVSYLGTAAGRKLEVFIDAQTCRDSMSGEFFAYSARATLDDKEFTGCARVGQ